MTKETVHFIGIGGIGMSGLARILLQQGRAVTGSDLQATYVTEDLEKQGAAIMIGHRKENVSEARCVIYSSDIPQDNPELVKARELNYPLLHRSDLLLSLMKGKDGLAVTGTHGKTTTSALLAHVLFTAGLDPAYAVGGIVPTLASNAGYGKGNYFVIEADESDATFLKYPCAAAIVTNIDNDHIAHYGSMERLLEAFSQFIAAVHNKKLLFFCGDDTHLRTLIAKDGSHEAVSYGFSSACNVRISNDRGIEWKSIFDVTIGEKTYRDVEIALSGKHNMLNAVAVFALTMALGVPEEDIRRGLITFGGVKRRMEKKGEVSSVMIIDDYAHHPTEVRATLQALRKAVGPKRIISIYQPHRYSRMQYCNDFQDCFHDSDMIVVTDLHTANETPIPGVSTERICDLISASNKRPFRYIPRGGLVEQLYSLIRPHDVVIFLGAGDITRAASQMKEKIEREGVIRWHVGLLYGGMSSEHEVSCTTKRSIEKNLDRLLYEVEEFYITKKGHITREGQPAESAPLTSSVLERLMECDLFLPVLHGPFGEDGTVQGLLDMLQKPYVGCDVRSCAVGMDKAFSKWIAESNGIATSPFFTVSSHEWKKSRDHVVSQITYRLIFPLFIKPSHLGSSVGVSKVTDRNELAAAIDKALSLDTHIVIEQEIIGREIEFALLGNSSSENGEVKVSLPGEILTNGKIYTYEAKYGKNAFRSELNPELSPELVKEGQEIAKKIYRVTSSQGLARVDFFLDQKNKFWFNEINPFPGFTENSLYPRMWGNSGLGYKELLDELIILALEKKRMVDYHFGGVYSG